MGGWTFDEPIFNLACACEHSVSYTTFANLMLSAGLCYAAVLTACDVKFSPKLRGRMSVCLPGELLRIQLVPLRRVSAFR